MKRSTIDFVDLENGSGVWANGPAAQSQELRGTGYFFNGCLLTVAGEDLGRSVAGKSFDMVRVLGGSWAMDTLEVVEAMGQKDERTKGTKGFAWMEANGWLGVRPPWGGNLPGLPSVARDELKRGTLQGVQTGLQSGQITGWGCQNVGYISLDLA